MRKHTLHLLLAGIFAAGILVGCTGPSESDQPPAGNASQNGPTGGPPPGMGSNGPGTNGG